MTELENASALEDTEMGYVEYAATPRLTEPATAVTVFTVNVTTPPGFMVVDCGTRVTMVSSWQDFAFK